MGCAVIPRRAAAAPVIRPCGPRGSGPLPSLLAPTTDDVAELERLATDYAAEHADATDLATPHLALLALNALVAHAGLVAGPVGPPPYGPATRWRARPPAPGVIEARYRLAGVEMPSRPFTALDALSDPWTSRPPAIGVLEARSRVATPAPF